MRHRLAKGRRMKGRGAATLVEVLVAIFVMAIGMITLLTLFPLGLLSMAQAIKDDRTALAAASAAAIERIWDIRHAGNRPLGQPAACTPPAGAFWTTNGAGVVAGFFSNPATNPNAPVGLPAIPSIPGGPGYPIYVDPFAFSGAAGTGTVNPSYGNIVGSGPGMQRVDIGINQRAIIDASNTSPIAITSALHGLTNGALVLVSGVVGNTAANGRFKVTFIDTNRFSLDGSNGNGSYLNGGVWQYAFPDQATAWRTAWFTLLDDIEFENNGIPSPGNPTAINTIFREDRYTWAYLLRMGEINTPNVVNLTIVVYSGRTQLSGEKTFPASWSAAGNVVTLNFAGLDKPAIRKGGWILDNTVVVGSTPNTNGYFYRVVNVNEGASGPNTTDLEVQPARLRQTLGGTNPGLGSVVVMDGVVEVFERGSVTP